MWWESLGSSVSRRNREKMARSTRLIRLKRRPVEWIESPHKFITSSAFCRNEKNSDLAVWETALLLFPIVSTLFRWFSILTILARRSKSTDPARLLASCLWHHKDHLTDNASALWATIIRCSIVARRIQKKISNGTAVENLTEGGEGETWSPP